MKQIEIRGAFSTRKRRPATLDIQARTSLCLTHMVQNSDPRFDYVPFVGVTLGEDPPHFVHHRLDWTEVLPYSIYGMVIARDITGSDVGIDVQAAQQKLYLRYFNELDGFIHAPGSPWNKPYPLCLWEQTRALYALIYWFLDDGDERLLERILALVEGLFSMSSQEGKQRVFPYGAIRNVGMGYYGVGSLIDPLTKVYELTGNSRAFQMAEGLTHFMLSQRNGFFDPTGKFSTFFRTIASVINGLSRFAALVDEPGIVEKAKTIHDHATSLCTSYGSTPCTEPACSNMELTQSALSFTRLGHDEYWDQIDRWARNQTTEAQFLDPKEWVKAKAFKGRILDKETWVYEGYPPGDALLPFDDYRNVVQRSIGGFMWTSADEHLFVPASLMLCCSAHALRTFHLLWQNSLTEDINGLKVNLHYTVENSLGEVISYEPYEGKTIVIPKKDAHLRVLIPEHARGSAVKGLVAGKPCSIDVAGRYAGFGRVKAGTECTLEFALSPRVTEERQFVFENKDCAKLVSVLPYQARWRGNTVVEVRPQSVQEKRIYKRAHLDTEKAAMQDFAHFISSKAIRW